MSPALRQIAGYCLGLEAEEPRLAALLPEVYSGAEATGRPQRHFALRGTPGQWELADEDGALVTGRGLKGLFQETERHLTGAFMAGLDGFLQIHGGAVVRDGVAHLLVGAPEAGKTSLSLALGLDGGALLTDEVALVEPDRCCLYSFRRDLVVHRGTARLFGDWLAGVSLPAWKRFAAYSYVPPAWVSAEAGEAPLGRLVFPQFIPGAAEERLDLGPAEAARRLLDQCFNGGVWGGRCIEAVARLAEAVPACQLRFGDARRAAAAWDALTAPRAP